MKLTKKKIIYSILEVLFILIVPLILICIEYAGIEDTKATLGFKIEFLGVFLIIVVLLIFKRTVLKRWLDKVKQQSVDLDKDLKIEVEEGKVANIERELKKTRTVECVFSALLPFLFLTLCLVMCKGLEQAIIKLSGVLGFTLISFCIGTIFSVLNAREVHSKNIKEDKIKEIK